MGPMTPTKVASFLLFGAGVAILLFGARLVPGWDGGFAIALAALVLSSSFLVDALLPGGSELTADQVAMLKHVGVPYRPGAEKLLSIAIGIVLLLTGVYLIA